MKIKSTALAVLASLTYCVTMSLGATVAQQDFESSPASPVLTYTTTGISELNSGAVTGTFSPTGSTWGVNSSRGISFSSDSGTITFSAINTIGLNGIELTLRLAALSINSASNGLDGGDSFIVSISPDNGATFYDQLRINGNNNARWSFSAATGVAARTYSSILAPTVFAPAGGGVRVADGFTDLRVTGLPSVSNLVIRLTATDDNVDERWLVDNVIVSAVPEPSGALLGAIGVLALLRRRR